MTEKDFAEVEKKTFFCDCYNWNEQIVCFELSEKGYILFLVVCYFFLMGRDETRTRRDLVMW